MKTFKMEITIKVADSWIADGFDLNERLEDVENQLSNLLPFAVGSELKIKAKIVKSPTKREIKDLQDGIVEIKD